MLRGDANAVTGPGSVTAALSQVGLLPADENVTLQVSATFAESRAAVTPRSVAAAAGSHQLLLSIFPGIDLLGTGFELEGYSVVRGPDLLFGGDVRRFHVPAGRFDGVIGGSPCPDFSRARRAAPSGYGEEMLAEFARVVEEAGPTWWLLENVPGVPDLVIPGYSHQRIDLNAREVGLAQNRHRHFQFGHRDGWLVTIARAPKLKAYEACCIASEAGRPGRRDWAKFCELQGLPPGFALDQLTLSARYRAVGNGVPVPMARALAQAIRGALPPDIISVCGCGCGRPLLGGGRARYAVPACRKRMERRRKAG